MTAGFPPRAAVDVGGTVAWLAFLHTGGMAMVAGFPPWAAVDVGGAVAWLAFLERAGRAPEPAEVALRPWRGAVDGVVWAGLVVFVDVVVVVVGVRVGFEIALGFGRGVQSWSGG